ncbi:MAG: two-component regulator propeller domain-containing protein [Bacteroidota bacterium]
MCLFPFILPAQEFQPYFHRFGTENGLPSSEVYCTQQDHEGYIWIGTDNGVARFNGHSFKVFDSDDGLEDPVVFSIKVDSNGVVWCSTYSEGIFYYDNGVFKPHPQNDILKGWMEGRGVVKLIDPDYSQGFLLLVKYVGLYYFKDSIPRRVYFGNRDETLVYRNIPDLDQPYVNNRIYAIPHLMNVVSSHRVHAKNNNSNWDEVTVLEDFPGYIRKIIEAPGERNAFLAFSDTDLWYIRDGEIHAQHSGDFSSITYLHPYREDALLVGRQSGNGLLYIKNWQNQGELFTSTSLPDRSIGYINFDQAGGIWVSTLDKGLFYSSHPNQIFYQQGVHLPDSRLMCTAPVSDNLFFANFLDGTTTIFNQSENKVISRYGAVVEMLYDKKSNLLLTGLFDATITLKNNFLDSVKNMRPFPTVNYFSQNFGQINYTTCNSSKYDTVLFYSGKFIRKVYSIIH